MKIEYEDVQRAYDNLMAANAAEPYVHANYTAADLVLQHLAADYYGDVHVEDAREIMLDCGEVWAVQRVIDYKTTNVRGEMNQAIEFLVWATDRDYIEKLAGDIARFTYDLLAIDARYDVGSWIDAAMVRATREKATQMSGRALRKSNAEMRADR